MIGEITKPEYGTGGVSCQLAKFSVLLWKGTPPALSGYARPCRALEARDFSRVRVHGCLSHTGKWKQIAESVNHRFPNYTIKRCTSAEEKGIDPATVVRRNGSSCEYCIQCTKCGSRIIRERMSKAVQYPERYRCAKCGGDLVRVY